ncbi:MFS transporter [Campylobacter sp. MIT 12-5580]|uniref:peptide MFS transporter n=1 Tax=Campylobacter sp. MIT 12-5580 TaxID=2040651 RepID=UPI0010F87649|nr:peptide MFS transporter [Campylobacter sp. MIT 12-5580]TKX28674.1 MFS transporter [Campylobacter sp. MIT 12-5580]
MKDKINTSFLGHPKPLFSLSMTELWERFSFYGIRPLLVLFMAATLFEGGLGIDRSEAAAIVGIFGGCLYLAALPGGWLADNLFGQKKAVFYGAVIIALGHLLIALSFFWHASFFLGLAFIVAGTGLFKTCSSVMVGMLYTKEDARRDSGFTIFYMGINIGAFVAPLICGAVQQNFGYHLGFGIGGLGMLVALIIFYFKTIPDFYEFQNLHLINAQWDKITGTNSRLAKGFIVAIVSIFALLFILCVSGFLTINSVSLSKNMIFIILVCTLVYFAYLFIFLKLDRREKKNLIVLIVLFIAAVFFWGAFEQKPTSFNLFAQDFTDRIIFGYEIPAAWSQALNPLFIIIFAPLMSAFWIFLAKKGFELSSITKFALGVIGAGLGFGVMIFAAKLVLASGGQSVSMLWLIVSIWFLTMGELCLSPVGLSIMSKIAPKIIQNQVMGLWFVTSALGNIVAGLIGGGVRADEIENLPTLFFQCALALFIIALVLFIVKKPIYAMLKKEEK